MNGATSVPFANYLIIIRKGMQNYLNLQGWVEQLTLRSLYAYELDTWIVELDEKERTEIEKRTGRVSWKILLALLVLLHSPQHNILG